MNSADIATLVPNPDDLLALSAEEQGRLILKLWLMSGSNEGIGPTKSGRVNQHNFFNRGNDYAAPPKYGRQAQEGVDKALLVAWAWLERQGLVVRDPSHGPDWFLFTDEARALGLREDTTAYSSANLLPKNQLHSLIAAKVYPA